MMFKRFFMVFLFVLVSIPVRAEFLTQDPWEGEVDNPPSLNKYIYTYQNPTRYIDPDGKEAVVVSGHPGEKMTVKTHFLTNGIDRAKALQSSGKNTTWIIYKGEKSGYSQGDLDRFTSEAREAKVNVFVTNKESDIVNYVNSKDDQNSRAEDQITDFTYVGHGLPNKLVTNYDGDDHGRPGLNIQDFRSDAFASGCTVNLAASCNAATKIGGVSTLDQFGEKVDSQSTLKGVIGTVDFRTPEVDSDRELLIDGRQRRNENMSIFQDMFPDDAVSVTQKGTSDLLGDSLSTGVVTESSSGVGVVLEDDSK
jgi:hypothetical protein